MDIININNSDSDTSFNLYESEDQHSCINTNYNNNEINEDVEINSIKLNSDKSKSNKSKSDKSKSNIKITVNDKIFIRSELLKRKLYYKILLSDYKKFIKKINFYSTNTETSYDKSIVTRKSFDKAKNYNIKDTHITLYNNIKKIKKDLFFVFENFNNKILILDGENILKSFKYQQLIKQHITQTEYDIYFNYWYNGSDNGFIQPMTSLNLSVNDKIFLISQIVNNYLDSFNCIIIISGKILTDSNIKSSFINQNKSIIIPVIYNKEDIREQDDHLLLYIFYHLSKIKNCEIISGDKFSWFNHTNNYLKNFVLEYNFDEGKINILILNAYTNDIIIYKNNKYHLGYYYFPFIKNISHVLYNNLQINNNILDDFIANDYEKILLLLKNKDYNNINILLINIFLILIELNFNYENNIILIQKYSEFITNLISKIIYFNKPFFDEILVILSKVALLENKIFDKIEKYDSYILYKKIFESNDGLLNLSNKNLSDNPDIKKLQEYINFKTIINNYIFITEIYLIFKSMSFLLNSTKSIIKIAKLFSYIMKIYDKIENSIYKIRKISNNLNDFNKIFLSILSHHIFMKKNGFCKKDY